MHLVGGLPLDAVEVLELAGASAECGTGRYFAPEAMPAVFALHREVAVLD